MESPSSHFDKLPFDKLILRQAQDEDIQAYPRAELVEA
jgi:hypothetical protein